MTLRAVVLGLLLGVLISIGTYFNDWVIGQTQLIGNQLPIVVFGLAALLVLALGPLLGRLWRGFLLSRSEVALIVALGLSACGWPGSNFFRTFTQVAALPSHWLKTKANWQATNVMSYVPGASAELGQGHVRDFRRLRERLRAGRDAASPTPASRVFGLLPATAQRALLTAEPAAETSGDAELVSGLNHVLREPALYEPAAFRQVPTPEPLRALLARPASQLPPHEVTLRNRLLLVAAFPDLLMPPPSGQGVLFDGGRADPFAVDTLLQGRSESARLSPLQLPWGKWWPTLRLWAGVALLLGLSSLCMALVVHPQWSKRELLPYPVARFIEEVAERREGALLPQVAYSKLFWIGCLALIFLHGVNGLHAWNDKIPEIPRNFDFWPLSTLFPNAVRVFGSWGFFGPTLYASVIAFSFFMATSVTFSLGVSQLLFFALGATLLSNGIQLESGGIEGKAANLLRFGSYFGIACVILYTGRRYYVSVLGSALGRRRSAETPAYAMWAARLLIAAVALAILLVRSAGLELGIAVAFVLLELLMILVMTRIVTETGTFFMQAQWAPVGILTALFGFQAIGPTAYIVLCMASVMLFIDSREVFMPYLSHGLKLTDRPDGVAPARVAPWFALMLVLGLALSAVVTLYLQYNHGVSQKGNDWATNVLPTFAFDGLSQEISTSLSRGSLAAATQVEGVSRLWVAEPRSGVLIWVAAGLVLAVGAALLRLRLPWWPLHPVAFLVWGTYPIAMFGPSFILGWLLKAGVVGAAGARGYHTLRPLMIGVIAGELLAGLFWMAYGAAYYFISGKAPVMYNIFPG